MKIPRTAGRRRPRVILVAAAAVTAAGLLAVSLQSSSARAAATDKWTGAPRPVIVLEHGAWADSSSWDRVIARLAADGFTVYAPPDPLRGLSYDAAYLHDFLTENPALQGKQVILAGHSYGGAVITNAAVGDPEVKALVYVDAFIPEQGQTVKDLLGAAAGSCIGGNPETTFLPVPYPGAPTGGADLYLQTGEFPGCFASGLPATEAGELAATQRPLASTAVSEPSGTPAWATVPSWAVVGTADKVIPPAELLAMAADAGAHVTKVNAGHLSLISDPGAVTRVIIQAASATS
jgi:pimeloyl-ACP methyl ester carboxylesterase